MKYILHLYCWMANVHPHKYKVIGYILNSIHLIFGEI